jgi:uncharacterized protein YkwD
MPVNRPRPLGPRAQAADENQVTHLSRARTFSALALLAGALLPAASAAAASIQPAPARHAARRHAARHHVARHPAPRHATRRRPKGRPARVTTCANATTTAAAGNLVAMRAAVLCLVNQQRSSRGLPALSEDGRLDRSAQGWTATMVSSGQFTHGVNFAARISATGFVWSFAGENIATGFPTPARVIAGWMGSEGHCRNLLDPGFSDIGIGMVPHPTGGYASEPATWTQDFALPMGKGAPSHNTGPQSGCPY